MKRKHKDEYLAEVQALVAASKQSLEASKQREIEMEQIVAACGSAIAVPAVLEPGEIVEYNPDPVEAGKRGAAYGTRRVANLSIAGLSLLAVWWVSAARAPQA